LLTVDLSSLAPFFDIKPAASTDESPVSPQAPAGSAGTEELKQHTARLQEQLSNMNFAAPTADSLAKPMEEVGAAPSAEPAISLSGDKTVHESAAQILENASASSASPVLPEPLETSKPVPQASYSSSLEALEQEELKIPAWLEPLARNASAPSSAQELILREKGKRKAERGNVEEAAKEVATPVQREEPFESRVPEFGSALPLDDRRSDSEVSANKSGKGLLFAGIAAAVAMVAAGSWWYLNKQSAGSPASVVESQTPALSVPAQNSQANVTKETAPETNLSAQSGSTDTETFRTNPNSTAQPNSTKVVSNPSSASGSTIAARSAQGKSNSVNRGSVITASASTPVPRDPAPVEVKKPSLGEVHLATPKISHNHKISSGSEADAAVSLAEDQPGNNSDGLGAGLVNANGQPAAPAAPAPTAVGGDVKQAKLISSVPPVYPALAKTQHVAGNVVIDALIDPYGRVTETKIISGPAMLHEAAMNALRQWKYQPAMLDGKPVAMHLSVTIQFRLQQ